MESPLLEEKAAEKDKKNRRNGQTTKKVKTQWQTRSLESVYPILWLDAIHYKVREDNAIKTKAVYCFFNWIYNGSPNILQWLNHGSKTGAGLLKCLSSLT